MNYSKQRETMLNILRNTKSHPTANDIYVTMRRDNPKISLGTVYRNLALLTENGTIVRIDTEHNSVHYDGCTHPHYHFVCNECGTVTDLNIDTIDINKQVESELDCDVRGHTLVFYGRCSSCKKNSI